MKVWLSATSVLLTLLCFPALADDNPKVNVQMFRPSPHPGDIMGIFTSNQPKSLEWGVGAYFGFNSKPLSIAGTDARVVAWQGFAELQGNLGLFDFMDIGLALPLFISSGDEPLKTTPWAKQVDGFSLGDLRLSLKGTFLGGNGKGFGLALAEDLSFPTATGNNLTGDKLVTSTTNLVLDYSTKGWVAAINLGVRAKKTGQLLGNDSDHQLLIGAGLSVPFICGVLEGIGTMEARTQLTDPFASKYDNAVDLMAGLRLNLGGFTLVAAGGGGALEAYGSPAWRAVLNAQYASAPCEKGCIKDTDKDGIPDPEDACPTEAGPVATKGCPDRDGDGVPDREDRCPDVAGLVDLGGCPDKDGDGIMDTTDLCPDKPGLVKFNGCPDTDKDDIPDNKDACPTEAGPAKTNGCPDRDGDGVIDKEDKCPDMYGKKEYNGCPPPTPSTVKLTGQKIEILQQVHFETNKAVIRPDSFQLLRDVAKVLKDNPQLRKVRVEGHTDNVGKPQKNMVLSQKRAEAVKDFLVKAGVEADRLEPKGYGDTKPVADNKKPEGRALNRRVEFVIVETAPVNQ